MHVLFLTLVVFIFNIGCVVYLTLEMLVFVILIIIFECWIHHIIISLHFSLYGYIFLSCWVCFIFNDGASYSVIMDNQIFILGTFLSDARYYHILMKVDRENVVVS